MNRVVHIDGKSVFPLPVHPKAGARLAYEQKTVAIGTGVLAWAGWNVLRGRTAGDALTSSASAGP